MVSNLDFSSMIRSGINPNDLYSIYEYLTGLLFPKCSAEDVRGGSLTRNYSNGLDTQFGAFLAGPTTQSDNCKKPPTVYICNDGQCVVYKMIVYNALSGTLCLFVKGKIKNFRFLCSITHAEEIFHFQIKIL